jgi:hypothetical protein
MGRRNGFCAHSWIRVERTLLNASIDDEPENEQDRASAEQPRRETGQRLLNPISVESSNSAPAKFCPH